VQSQTGGLLAGTTPAWLARLASPGSDTLGVDVPPMVAIWALVAVLMGLFLHRTVAGRRIFATGANPGAAEHALINTRRVWTAAFAFSAIASVFVGLLVGGASTARSGTRICSRASSR
jgi:ribose transport system permease protein